MRIDDDAWGDWLGHPITEQLFKMCRVRAERQKARWLEISWDGRQTDPTILARLQERALTLTELTEVKREDLEDIT